VLPATLPSIFTGMTVGMGITWEVVVAAEMIAGSPGSVISPGLPAWGATMRRSSSG
jgi:NitT/TauT family transport system permease protein